MVRKHEPLLAECLDGCRVRAFHEYERIIEIEVPRDGMGPLADPGMQASIDAAIHAFGIKTLRVRVAC
jgi:hypothetical protein